MKHAGFVHRELNSLGIWYQLGKVTKSQETTHKTSSSSTTALDVVR